MRYHIFACGPATRNADNADALGTAEAIVRPSDGIWPNSARHVRPLLALLIFVIAGNAQAQYPLGYSQNPPNRRPNPPDYAAPVRGGSPSSLVQSMLDAHNAVRAAVGVPPLMWSAQLAEVAQDWANHLIATGSLSHRPSNRYGENLYSISGGAASPAQVVKYWADEARGYDIASNACAGVCGHYTQIVWGKTRAVGCAVANDAQREVWVCNYDPPGNAIGYRPY
jgi:pathogenesis-related protein 1